MPWNSQVTMEREPFFPMLPLCSVKSAFNKKIYQTINLDLWIHIYNSYF